MRKTYGMTPRKPTFQELKKLAKLLNPPPANYETTFLTVEEYIAANPDSVTNRRISKRGTELVEVTYPTGMVKEYPLSHIHRTTACEY